MENEVSFRILYRDESCLVVNKLSGEAVEGAAPGMGDLPRLLAAVLDANENDPDRLALPSAVHRLDVPVSGCVVFARTRRALSFLNAAFADHAGRAVEKHYWAIVEAPPVETPIPESGALVHWIRFDPRKNRSVAYNEPGPGRKKAELEYRITGRGHHYLFLDIRLVTGRHHQIRSQLARLRLHIKGDLKYGARRSEKGGGIRLHARSVSFPDPSGNGGRISASACPPSCDNLWKAFMSASLVQ